jgi:hypothetical protein
MRKQAESIADFRQRIAIIMRERETGKKYSIVGAAHAHPCVVRSHNPRKANNNGNDNEKS